LGGGAGPAGLETGSGADEVDATGVESATEVEGGDTADVEAGGELEEAVAAAGGDGGGAGAGGGDDDGPTTKLMPGSRPPVAETVSE
jgi:hypothetical protein